MGASIEKKTNKNLKFVWSYLKTGSHSNIFWIKPKLADDEKQKGPAGAGKKMKSETARVDISDPRQSWMAPS